MHTVLVNATEIATYLETVVRGIYTALLAYQISLQSEIFTLPCFRYLHRHYPREIGENGRAFLPVACLLEFLLLLLHFSLQNQPLLVVRL